MLILAMTLLIQAASPDPTPEQIRALIAQAGTEREGGRLTAAFTAADAAIAGARRLSPADPLLLADALVARCDAEAQKADGSDADCQEAMTLRRPLLGDADPRVLNLDIQLAVTDVMKGRPERAEPVVRRSVAGLKALPETATLNTDVGMGVAVQGMVEEALRRPTEAEARYREAIAILDRADPLGLRYRPIVYNYLNALLLGQGRAAEAAETTRIAVAIQREMAPPGDPQTIGALIRLGLVQQRAGLLTQAEATARECLDLLDAQDAPALGYRYQALSLLGGVQADLGRPELALPLLERAEAVALSLPDGAERRAAPVRLRIAALKLQSGDAAGALAVAQAALPGTRQDLSGREGEATALIHIATAQARLGDLAAARTSAEAALAIREAAVPGSPASAAPLALLADIALQDGRPDEARSLLDRAVAATEGDTPLSSTRLSIRNARVALALAGAGTITPDIETLADDTAGDAAALILTNARSGARAEGVADITRAALGGAIETRWRAQAQ